MTSALISFFVLAAFFAVAVILGFRLARSAKPYPKILLSAHIVFFFLIAVGIGACMNTIETALSASSLAIVSLCFAGPAIIALFVTDIVMIFSKQKKRGWIFAHKLAMYFLGASIAGAGICLALKR